MAGIDILNNLQGRGIDFGSSVSVTGAATLDTSALGKIVVCSGTSADYTVGLPAAAESNGKRIVLLMGLGLTKLVALDGNASETIDGSASRIMWKSELAELWCDGTQWVKVGGKSIPMQAGLYANAGQLFPAGTDTTITIDTAKITPSVASMHDLANKKIVVARSSNYLLTASIQWNNTNASATRTVVRGHTGTVPIGYSGYAYLPANGAGYSNVRVGIDSIQAGTSIYLRGLFDSGSFSTSSTSYGDSSRCFLSVSEIPQW